MSSLTVLEPSVGPFLNQTTALMPNREIVDHSFFIELLFCAASVRSGVGVSGFKSISSPNFFLSNVSDELPSSQGPNSFLFDSSGSFKE